MTDNKIVKVDHVSIRGFPFAFKTIRRLSDRLNEGAELVLIGNVGCFSLELLPDRVQVAVLMTVVSKDTSAIGLQLDLECPNELIIRKDARVMVSRNCPRCSTFPSLSTV